MLKSICLPLRCGCVECSGFCVDRRARCFIPYFIRLDEEGYKKQEVKLGANNGAEVQILSGLKPGDTVVTQGAYQVKLASASNAIPAHTHNH